MGRLSKKVVIALATVAVHLPNALSFSDEEVNVLTLPLLHHHHVISRHLKESQQVSNDEKVLSESFFPSGTLYQGFGTHYVDLWVGSPPQRTTLIVDTGSDATAFPCQTCTDCGEKYHTDNFYRHNDSSSFEKVTCETCSIGKCKLDKEEAKFCWVGTSYAEGSSWEAFEATDTVYLGGPHDEPLVRGRRRRMVDVDDQEDGEEEEESIGGGDSEEEDIEEDIEEEDETEEAETKEESEKPTKQGNLRHNNSTASNTNKLEENFKKIAKELELEYEEEHRKKVSANKFSFLLSFGCQYKITGLFKTQLADGIMGMEQSGDSFWMQMYQANIIQRKMFALCFVHSDEVERSGTSAGAMTLGGADTRLHKTKMVYAENDSADGWYTVYVTAIYIERKFDDDREPKVVKLDLDIPNLNEKGIIVDSGTTDSYLPDMVGAPFKDSYAELFDRKFLKSFIWKEGGQPNLDRDYPTIKIQLRAAAVRLEGDDETDEVKGLAGSLDPSSPRDVIVEIPPSQYMRKSKVTTNYNAQFHMDDKSGFGVLGANSMFGYDILFDMENQRVGFAESDCDHTLIDDSA